MTGNINSHLRSREQKLIQQCSTVDFIIIAFSYFLTFCLPLCSSYPVSTGDLPSILTRVCCSRGQKNMSLLVLSGVRQLYYPTDYPLMYWSSPRLHLGLHEGVVWTGCVLQYVLSLKCYKSWSSAYHTGGDGLNYFKAVIHIQTWGRCWFPQWDF